MKTFSPNEIHTTLISEIYNLIHSLKTETSDEEIRKSQEDAQKQLMVVHSELNSSLKSLQMNVEWDIFSIAFYGETNAGKSTLIETLRILLNEPNKVKEREEFKKINDTIEDKQKQIEQSENLIEQTNIEYQLKVDEIEDYNNYINFHKANFESQINQLKDNIDEIENQMKSKCESSFVNYIRAIFGMFKEQQEYRVFKKKYTYYKSELVELDIERPKIEYSRENVQNEWYLIAESMKKNKEELEKDVNQILGELSEHCDGKIIGDGHSDFTREVTTYQFDYCGQKFSLLDLPGIEGKEDLVLNVINDAVQKAHAVFFVSGKPTPPQTGNKNSAGTLEKIIKHLGQQTEVYTIFNKRIKNHQQLQPGLVNDDERKCLIDFDAIMRDRLGEQYGNHIVLSAYPAFLSIANCSQNDFEKAQNKFFEKYESQANLLQASQMKSFSDWIKVDLVKNCKTKIKKSNYKKVSISLLQTTEKLHEIQNSLLELQRKLINTKKATDNQLEEASEILKQQLETEAYKAIDEFKTLLRSNIYIDIESKLNYDELKYTFDYRINEAVNILSGNLKEKFDIVMSEFKNDIINIIEKYNRYTSELLNAYKNMEQFDFDFILNIDIKSGVNWGGLIASIITGISGILISLTNPVGWVVLVLSFIGAVINIGKAVMGAFNRKYKISQQKKIADENIEKIGDRILEAVLGNIKDCNIPLQEGIAGIKDELLNSVNHIKSMNLVISNAETKFKLLITTVEKQGVS